MEINCLFECSTTKVTCVKNLQTIPPCLMKNRSVFITRAFCFSSPWKKKKLFRLYDAKLCHRASGHEMVQAARWRTLFCFVLFCVRSLGLTFTWWGWDVAAYVFTISQPSLPTPFYSVLVTVSVCMALSTVFHSITSPDNSAFSHSVLPVSFLPYWSFQLYISLWKSPSALI